MSDALGGPHGERSETWSSDPSRTPSDVERVSRRVLHQGRIFTVAHEVVRLSSGLEQALDVVEHPGAVAIAARDEEGRLLLVRQYRHAVGAWTRELPAGRLEGGESPLDAARRELEEETGHRAREWMLLRVITPAPGFCSERVHLFQALGLELVEGEPLARDPDEELELLRATPEEILRGGFEDAKTLVAAALLVVRFG